MHDANRKRHAVSITVARHGVNLFVVLGYVRSRTYAEAPRFSLRVVSTRLFAQYARRK